MLRSFLIEGGLAPYAAKAAHPRRCAARAVKRYAPLLQPMIFAVTLFTAPLAHAEIKVETTTISHGVKAWYAETSVTPVVDVVISFEGAGSASDPEGKAGRAAFAASLLTEGAGDMSSAAFRRALEDKAITLTAETDEDRLRIHIYTLRDHAVEAGKLLAIALEKPTLAEADQARMKADIGSLIARLNERPSYRAERLLLERAYKGHPYSNMPYGNATTLAALNASDVRDYLSTYVTRGNILIAAAGDVDASLLDDMLEPVVDVLAANDSGPVSIAKTNVQGAGETLHATMPVPQTTILFAAPGISRDDPRYYAQYILNRILGGNTLTSRLGDEIRQKKGLVYGIDTDLEMNRGAATLRGSLSTRNANAEAALEAVKSVLGELHTKGASVEECDDAKNYVIGAFARQLDSSGAVSNLLLGMQIHKLGTDYIEKRNTYFSSVSCSDVNAVASELLNPANFVFAIVGGTPEAGGAVPVKAPTTPANDVK